MKKAILGLLAAVVVAALAFGFWRWRHNERLPQYQTATVSRGEVTQTVTATGQLNPVTNVQVGCQISGQIAQLYVDFNSPVRAGQVIAQLDPSTYEAHLRQAEGDLASARAALELAQVNERRSRQLLADKLISQADYDTVVAHLHQAEATVRNKEAAVENARVNLARCTIYSPVDGIVISRSVDVGQTVAASLNAPTLFQIANDLSQMHIHANVSEADIGGVEEGQEVTFTVDAFPHRTFRGTVVQIRNAPVTVQNVVTYDTIIAVHNPDLKLKPGMTANVSIIIAHRDDALRIPNAALRFRPPDTNDSSPARTAAGNPAPGRGARADRSRPSRGSQPTLRTVYVLAEGEKNPQPRPVPIRTGISDGLFTEVLEGLQEGDRVITAALSRSPSSTGPASPFGGFPRRF